jgi:hypothetical protein
VQQSFHVLDGGGVAIERHHVVAPGWPKSPVLGNAEVRAPGRDLVRLHVAAFALDCRRRFMFQVFNRACLCGRRRFDQILCSS